MHTASCRITALLSWLNGSLWQLLRFVSRLTVFITHLKSHSSYLEFLEDCSEQHISRCTLKHLTPAPHWKVTVGDPKLTRKNNFRIRLLTGCDGLEHDAARFRTRSHYGALPGDSSCKLCNAEVEDPEHFVSWCPALSACRDDLLALTTPQVRLRIASEKQHTAASDNR